MRNGVEAINANCPKIRKSSHFYKDRLMHRYIATAALLALCLTGCTGNYKYSDDQYRPLGEPQAVKRGN